MRKPKPTNNETRKHQHVQRDAIQDIREAGPSRDVEYSAQIYAQPNRDRSIGDTDRTGRHFDEGTKNETE
jgi:hypothetical protein